MKETISIYSQKLIEQLNRDIEQFDIIFKIEPEYNKHFDGIKRLIMLDRYSQKDNQLITLKKDDLVIATIEKDILYPRKVLAYVKKVENNFVTIELDPEYSSFQINEDNSFIKLHKENIEKPLEIFYEQITKRVSNNIALLEKNNIRNQISDNFYKELTNLNFVPAGRILYGAGSNAKITFFNCFVLPMIEDSRKGISDHREKVMEIMSRGGGVGTNGSTLRPRNTIAKTVNGKSSGAVSWLNDIAQLTHLVQQGGSRRGAQMIMLADWHPDIIEFIISKIQKPEILNFIKNNFKNEKIIELAKNRIEFNFISEEQLDIYKRILETKTIKNEKIIEFAKNQVETKGTFAIKDKNFLTGANISVTITDKFMDAIKHNKSWILKFPDIGNMNEKQKEFYDKNWHKIGNVFEWEKMGMPIKEYEKIHAQELWDLIVLSATYSAEPGVFFIDTANKFTNASVYNEKVIATNPCGEQPLSAYSVCNLGALNLVQFIDKKTKDVLWNKLDNTIKNSVRFLDNVIDSTPYFLSENEKQAKGERRLGLGVMGLHDMLIWGGIEYGSKQSLEFIDKLFNFIANQSYLASIELAKEKGEFEFLKGKNKKEHIERKQKMASTNFVKKLSKDVADSIKKYGIRNSHLLTIAPTGTTGSMIGGSTGLEPYFGFKFYRSGRLGKNIQINQPIVEEYLNYHDIKLQDENKLPSVFVTAMELTPEQHTDVQCTIQKWIDSSISKTVNAPKGYSVKQVEKIYLRLFEGGAKGGTVYVDGSRDSQVLSLTNTKKQKTNEEAKIEDQQESMFSTNEFKLEIHKKDESKVGINIGDICPVCLEGHMQDSGGCTTCDKCGSQLKCHL